MRRYLVWATAMLLSVALPLPASAAREASGTRDAACSRAATTQLVRDFIRSYNRGDLDRLDSLWAPEPDFQWYFVDDEREQDSENRETLRSYFAGRFLANDHLRLRRLTVRPDGANFGFKLRRVTDENRDSASGLFHGKGAARDSAPQASLSEPFPQPSCLLVVWAMDKHAR